MDENFERKLHSYNTISYDKYVFLLIGNFSKKKKKKKRNNNRTHRHPSNFHSYNPPRLKEHLTQKKFENGF